MSIDQYIREEVRRQLRRRKRRRELGAPPPQNEDGYTASAVHIEDNLGMWSLQKEITKLSQIFNLGENTLKKLKNQAEGYSRFWTVEDLRQAMSPALEDMDEEDQSIILARLEDWYARMRPKDLGESGFFRRIRATAKLLKWWEILLLGMGAAGCGVVLYEIYQSATSAKSRGQIVRFTEPVRTALPGRP